VTAAQVIEAARILEAEALCQPRRIVSFNAEGSEGVYMRVKPLTKKQVSFAEEWKRTRTWLISRDGSSFERGAA
jgi:hypothetical protein